MSTPREPINPAAPRILLVDDQPTFLEQACFFLEMEGFEVLTAPDGEKALQALNHFQPDLILADIMMPKMNGFELCRAVRALERFKKTPFLFVSARDQGEQETEAGDLLADGYVSKPFDPDALLAKIRSYLGDRPSNSNSDPEPKVDDPNPPSWEGSTVPD